MPGLRRVFFRWPRAVAPATQGRIVQLRDKRVMLDADLADFHGVETRVLVQAVRNVSPRRGVDSRRR